MKLLNRHEDLKQNCPQCKTSPNWIIVKTIDSADRPRYPYACEKCGFRTQLFVKKEKVPRKILEGDSVKESPPNLERCAKCNELTHVEDHHWAPRKYFDNADDWPKSKLCRKCHAEWHRKVTGDRL